MNVIDTPIQGVKIIEPRIFGDARGYFFEAWKLAEFEANIGHVDFIQEPFRGGCGARFTFPIASFHTG